MTPDERIEIPDEDSEVDRSVREMIDCVGETRDSYDRLTQVIERQGYLQRQVIAHGFLALVATIREAAKDSSPVDVRVVLPETREEFEYLVNSVADAVNRSNLRW